MLKSTTLTNLARYDKGLVGNEAFITEEGFIKGRAIVTRCGVFLYKNADGTIRKELRHPDDVMLSDSLESMKMIPIVDGHPTERLVNSENAKRLSVGYTGETVEMDSPYLIANLVITDNKIVKKIQEKQKNELSLGYTVDLLPEPGVYNGEPYDYRQTNIRYNHLALVDEARAGPEAKIVLDGDDAILVNPGEDMARKQRKIKIDAMEYMVDDEVGEHLEKLIKERDGLTEKMKNLHDEIDRLQAQRDSMRDKDMHDPKEVHEPLENDEIGENGKEKPDPIDSYGMQSHVKDYEAPSKMQNHVVEEPKNAHYPKDLPHVAKVDQADINRKVKERVNLLKYAERYLDKKTLSRIDEMDAIDIKKCLIGTLQKSANLNGKSEVYINARFDSMIETLPRNVVNATPAKMDYNHDEKDVADATQARKAMIKRQKDAYKGRG